MSEVNRLDPNDAVLEKFVDLPDLLARVENDRELLAELFVMFQEELPGLQNTLHHAMDVGDLPEGAKAAHALKGMLAPYPADEMTCWQVSTRVGNVKNNDPSLIEAIVLDPP